MQLRANRILLIILFVVCLAPFSCTGDANDTSPSKASYIFDDDDDSDDDAQDDDDTGANDDDDATVFEDDYIAPWPQSNIEPQNYDESGNAGDLRQKAMDYDRWHLENHQPYQGGTVSVAFTDDTRSVVDHYFEWNDSCEWTGLYMGSQAIRYHVTGDAQARDNVLRMVQMLSGNLYITDTPGYIARYWGEQDPLIYPGDAWCDDPAQVKCHHIETGPDAGKWWWGQTSRDMYNGWFFGMSLAYDMIDDEDMRDEIRSNVEHVLTVLIDQHWMILNEAGEPTGYGPYALPPWRMTWLTIGYHITGNEAFRVELAKWLKNDLRGFLRLLSISTMGHYAQYPGNCLSHEYFYNLLRLGKVYFSPDDYDFLVDLFETQAHTFTRLSHNPWFNGVFMSQGAYSPLNQDDPYQIQLEQDLGDFRPAPNFNYYLEERDPATYTLDPISVLLAELTDGPTLLRSMIGRVDYQATEAFPVNLQCSTDFLFQRNPFHINECGVDDPSVVNPGVDYLIAYWLASYHKFIPKGM
jgi:hypothetical protein